LSFARALAFDPKILILDEATSSVDTRTEELIQEALGELLKNRTALIVAHRLSTIKHADRILVIHKGEIWEEGSHAQLLARGGLYARLYDLQYRWQEGEPAMVQSAPGASSRGASLDQTPKAH
jgi:ABC-type multidrug transport system fused ATPase/permease subunit